MNIPDYITTTEQREAFTLVESYLRRAIDFADAYGGCIQDGQAFSPSDRALPHVEHIWQTATRLQRTKDP